jgi:hypothetical protein
VQKTSQSSNKILMRTLYTKTFLMRTLLFFALSVFRATNSAISSFEGFHECSQRTVWLTRPSRLHPAGLAIVPFEPFGITGEQYVQVSAVSEFSPAWHALIEPGDIITGIRLPLTKNATLSLVGRRAFRNFESEIKRAGTMFAFRLVRNAAGTSFYTSSQGKNHTSADSTDFV